MFGGGFVHVRSPDVMKVSATARAESGDAKSTESWIILTSPKRPPETGNVLILISVAFHEDSTMAAPGADSTQETSLAPHRKLMRLRRQAAGRYLQLLRFYNLHLDRYK